MTMRNCLLALALGLLSCTQEKTSAPAENPLVNEAKNAVLAHLRDPRSADFDKVFINSRNVVCGNVNAKNGFGGYIGFAAFWYDPTTKETYLYDPDQDWGGKGYDARVFLKKGCSIGSEEGKALRASQLLDESDRRLKEIGNE